MSALSSFPTRDYDPPSHRLFDLGQKYSTRHESPVSYLHITDFWVPAAAISESLALLSLSPIPS